MRIKNELGEDGSDEGGKARGRYVEGGGWNW